MKLTTIKSTRRGTKVVHLGENTGWSSLPFCGTLGPGRARQCDGTEAAHGTVNCRGCIVEADKRYLDVEQWIEISDRVQELIAGVRAHAVMNYHTGAWDVIVEAYSNSELAELVKTCRTEAGAIAKVAKVVELFTERRAPHDAEIAAATETTLFADSAQPELGEPDGSVVRATHSHDGELTSLTRTWPGKVGYATIEVDHYEDGPAPEYYHPGWRGVDLQSPNHCAHAAAPGEVCWNTACDRPQCCPF